MTDRSMRGFVSALGTCGDLHRVTRPVDLRFELGAVLALRDRGPAMLFEKGTTGPFPCGPFTHANFGASRQPFFSS
jgi:UbiD family decarboxylase